MAATRGMTRNPLAGRGEKRPDRSLSVVGAMQAQGGAPMVAVSDIAPNPDNPPNRAADVKDLVPSVREIGVLQALLLVPASAFLELHPEHSDAVGEREWVVVAGHRRLAASVEVGLTEVPAFTRQDLGDIGTDTAMLHENLNRAALSPIEEAVQYQRVMERHQLSQRDLARHAGVSQGQVSKRLALLKLPELILGAVAAGGVAADAALKFLDRPEPVRERAAQLIEQGEHTVDDLDGAARTAISRLTREAQLAEAQEAAEANGAEVVEDPWARWGSRSYDHAIHSKKDIAAAKKAGELAVAPGDGEPRFYRTSAPTKPASSHSEKQREEDLARKAATKARGAFLKTLVATPPSTTQMHDAVTSYVLGRGGLDVDLARIALPLTHAAGLTPQTKGADYYEWFETIETLSKTDGLHAAWVITIAKAERAAASPYGVWSSATAGYLDWLIEHGYGPTPWEKAQLKTAREAAK